MPGNLFIDWDEKFSRIKFPSSPSPVYQDRWSNYWSKDADNVFFDEADTYDGGDGISIVDNTGTYKELKPSIARLFTNSHTGYKFTIKVYLDKDGAKLLRAWEANNPASDEVLVYLEDNTADIISGTQMLLRSGNNVKIGNYSQDKNIYNWLNGSYKINRAAFSELLKSTGSKPTFIRVLQKIVKVLEPIIDFIPEHITIPLFEFVGNAIEKLKISDEVWKSGESITIVKILLTRNDSIGEYIDSVLKRYDGVIPLAARNFILKIKPVLAAILQPVTSIIKSNPELSLAAICGFINGFIDCIAGIFQFIALVLKASVSLNKAAADVAANASYYVALLFEYVDNFIQAISRIDWAKVIAYYYSKYNEFVTVVLPGLVLNADLRVFAYFAGYIICNVVIFFVPGVDAALITQLRKLGKPIEELFEFVRGIVSKFGKAGETATKSAEALLNFFDGLIAMLKNGTDEVMKFVDELFEAMKSALRDMISANSNITEDVNELLRRVDGLVDELGGKLLSQKELKLLGIKLQEKYGVTLRIIDKELAYQTLPVTKDGETIYVRSRELFKDWERKGTVGKFHEGPPPVLILRSNTSQLTVFHETIHLELWYNKVPKMHIVDEEKYVFEAIWKSRMKHNWSTDELIDAYDYVNKKIVAPWNRRGKKFSYIHNEFIEQLKVNKLLNIK